MLALVLKKIWQCLKPVQYAGSLLKKNQGFYYGTGYVSYALGVAICVTTFIAWFVLIGMSTHDNRFFYWLITNACHFSCYSTVDDAHIKKRLDLMVCKIRS
jgi:hypothetical protein